MKKHLCVVVIPIHKISPSAYELIAFQQCFRILGKHQIKIIAPAGLNLNNYKKLVPGFETIFINSKWLSSLINYNKLKLSRFFYSLFREYEFLLTYELDAFIFKDEIEYWCGKNYDYIGAPWIDFRQDSRGEIIGVGDSGFSLRKVDTISRILKRYFFRNAHDYETGKKNLIKAYIKFPIHWLNNQLKENYTIQKFCEINEDQFLCDIIPKHYSGFKIATVNDALQFSFEVNPGQLYKLNDNRLPMGCHAWWKYDLGFWKPHIEAFGYEFNHE